MGLKAWSLKSMTVLRGKKGGGEEGEKAIQQFLRLSFRGPYSPSRDMSKQALTVQLIIARAGEREKE